MLGVSPGHTARVSPGLLDPSVKGEPSSPAREGYLTFTRIAGVSRRSASM